jgi:peptidoglycan lytic transglycosylase G
MSEQLLDEPTEGDHGTRPQRGRGLKSCLAVLVALVVVVGGFYVAVTKGAQFVSDRFSSSASDFPGPGHGKVSFRVTPGETIAGMGRELKAKGVVASVDAFTAAANDDPHSTGIQVGYYALKKEMPAADALAVLVDPANIVKSTVTIPEGLRVTEILAVLADKTDFGRAAYEKVLRNPAAIGLPSYAHGNAEGYLFPSTYDFGPDATPRTILAAMVTRWRQAADDAHLESAAKKLGYTPAQLMTVASLVEGEAARDEDRGKVARVIYNRLEGDETNGLLQIDAAVNYGLHQKLGVGLTTAQLQQDTPYNTYTRPGLPPTPIEAPGDAAIAAAANPTPGGWYYYVTTNLRTGETKFATTYDQFLGYKRELERYCQTSSAC